MLPKTNKEKLQEYINEEAEIEEARESVLKALKFYEGRIAYKALKRCIYAMEKSLKAGLAK